MELNSIKPAPGSKAAGKRRGRGIAAGQGKTGGRGHKGQHSRSGGFTKTGFEGGQMPLQRRVPKVGFKSRTARFTAEVRLSELNAVEGDVVDLLSLKTANIVPEQARNVKVIASGEVAKAVTVRGVGVTKGARAAIEAAGGKVEE